MARKQGRTVPETPTSWMEDHCGRTNKVYCNTHLNFKGGTMFGLGKDEEEKGNKGYGLRKGPLGLILTEEFIEEDDYDEQILPEKKRRLTSEQINLLEKTFEVENKLEPETKGDLARKLGLHPRQIAIWFQNRRARWKTKQLERDYDQLKALYDAVLADNDALRANHDSVVNDNRRLREEVASLTEKLRNQHRTTDVSILAMLSPMTDLTVPEPVQAKFEVDHVDGPCTVSVGPPQPQSFEDHLSIESSTSAVADDQLPSAMNGESYFPVGEEGSYHGGHNYMVLSEEDEGGYFSSIYGENAVMAEHQPSDEEGECGTGFWIWH